MSMPVNDQGGGRLQQKLGPLQMWQWGGILLVGVFGYVWWARRQSAASSSASGDGSTDNSGTSYATDDMNSGDYASGYDYGYASGLNAGGDAGGSSSTPPADPGPVPATGGNAKGPIAHNKFTAKTKDPSGKTVTATGYGTWVKGTAGKWNWQPGIPKQYALPGNGTTAQAATAASQDVAAVGDDNSATSGAATLSGATGVSGAGTTSGPGSSAPAQTATTAQRIAQIIKDLQTPGPNYTQADQSRQLQTYQTLTGHAYSGKLGQLQVGQHVGYATV